MKYWENDFSMLKIKLMKKIKTSFKGSKFGGIYL